MEQREFIVAIDLGTSRITAIAGVKDALGLITVLAVDQEPSNGCIRRGCVYNVEETAAKVKKVISKLENKLSSRKIAKVYVGINGQSLCSVDHKVSLDLPVESTVSEEMIRNLYAEAKKFQPELLELLDAVHPRYEIDGKAEQNPIGVVTSSITAHYKMIVARPSLKRNIKSAIEKAGFTIAGYFAEPLAMGDFILSDSEKDLGCALINFGAGTTTLAIYKGGTLRHLFTIPFGGQSITKDICHLNIVENEAEQLKIRYGRVGPSDQLDQSIEVGTGTQSIKVSILNIVIGARETEIVENILNQLSQTGFYRTLGAGIILTGEAALMRGLGEMLKTKTGYEVKMSLSKHIQSTVGLAETLNSSYLQALSILSQGRENCAKEEPRAVVPHQGFERPATPSPTKKHPKKPKGGGLFGILKILEDKIEDATDSLFNDSDFK